MPRLRNLEIEYNGVTVKTNCPIDLSFDRFRKHVMRKFRINDKMENIHVFAFNSLLLNEHSFGRYLSTYLDVQMCVEIFVSSKPFAEIIKAIDEERQGDAKRRDDAKRAEEQRKQKLKAEMRKRFEELRGYDFSGLDQVPGEWQ